ncbi:hypothetical protein L195_g057452 [Trifolium pratense]|uniref:Uncharacterized protein n=1 Tax=Trifolium pratense TaxID=57577 RepID=A0A2K3KW41_TRIPR|nr:hypothetical protein L195_g057452 [Trifolium pratense]
MRAEFPDFDLVDKVSFDGYEDVTSNEEVEIEDEVETTPKLRAKRNIVRPKKLDGFEVPNLKKGSRAKGI